MRRRPPSRLRLALVLVALSFAVAAAPPPAGEERRVRVSDELSAVLSAGAIRVEARPLEGESVSEFASRVTRDATAAAALIAGRAPGDRSAVTLTYQALSPETQLAAIQALFPSDVRATSGWLHVAPEDAKLTAVALWFTGSASNAWELSRINGLKEAVPRGTTVTVPVELLSEAFRDAEAIEDTEPVKLEFGEDAKGKFALYRLRKGEALYSAVVVRFTGRLFAEDVIQFALNIAERSGIEDVHAIPVGFPIKIPLADLASEFLPKDDPKAQALARERAEASQFSSPTLARGLAGVRVVLDAGHGGRDAGTIHGGVWESTYVYDVACRLRKVLMERTKADVVMTTKEPSGFDAPERDRLLDSKRRFLLTDPPYPLADPVTGVNLRWYLANSLLRRPGPDRKPIPPDKTVFLSLHADSLHPSVRGVMAYVPGERFLRDRYGKKGTVYASYREWREEPVVSFQKRDRVAAEGISTRLAGRILTSIKGAGLPVHVFSPIRTHVVRGGREWVPAVLRYNRIPCRVLLEIANLGNDEDRSLTLKRSFRQEMAEAIARGLVAFFGGEDLPRVVPAKTAKAVAAPRAEKGTTPAAEVAPGPWPAPSGPWPEAAGPRPADFGPAPAPPRRDPRP